MRKRIYLQITPFFPDKDSFRGPYVLDQAKAIQKNSDFEVKIIKIVNNSQEKYIYDGVEVYPLKVIDIPSSILPGIFNKINYTKLKELIFKQMNLSVDEIEIIHAHTVYPAGYLAVKFAKEFNKKVFIQHHGLDILQFDNGRILKGFLRRINNYYKKIFFTSIIKQADLNIGVSKKVIEEIKKVADVKTYVLYNGVDKNKFYRLNTIKKENNFIIGCIGNFWPLKDQITLLKALNILIREKNIKDVKVIFIGSGPTLKDCQNFVIENQLEDFVEFKKEIHHKYLNEFYNQLDLFVLPSYYEALGCVYTEALQVGVPIIAVKNQGIEEIIREDEKKYSLINKKDYKQLAKNIEYFYKNKKNVIYDLDINKFIKNFLDFILRD